MKPIKNILIVCTGNSCRSPMAEAFLKNEFKPEEGFAIMSAGIASMDGLSPTKEAVEVMNGESLDISFFMSHELTPDLAKAADLILVMAEVHKKFILEHMPEVKDKVYLYKEFAGIIDGASKDVPDPIGKPINFYRAVKDEIKRASIEIAKKLKEVKN